MQCCGMSVYTWNGSLLFISVLFLSHSPWKIITKYSFSTTSLSLWRKTGGRRGKRFDGDRKNYRHLFSGEQYLINIIISIQCEKEAKSFDSEKRKICLWDINNSRLPNMPWDRKKGAQGERKQSRKKGVCKGWERILIAVFRKAWNLFWKLQL